MRLALGTVQFGLRYGVANRRGRTAAHEVREILRLAATHGVTLLDTAPAYGACERLLGSLLEAGGPFAIVTKTRRLREANDIDDPVSGVRASFTRTLRDLGRDRVYGLLIHDPEDATAPHAERIVDEMRRLQEAGSVEKIGLSIYGPEDAERFRHLDRIDLVQLPLSVMDQRLVNSGCLSELKARDIEIHVRSAFLQGLLLMPAEDVPEHFDPAAAVLDRWRGDLRDAGVSPVAGALGFLGGIAEVDRVVVGAATAAQFRETVLAADAAPPLDYPAYACDLEDVIDPRRWPSFH